MGSSLAAAEVPNVHHEIRICWQWASDKCGRLEILSFHNVQHPSAFALNFMKTSCQGKETMRVPCNLYELWCHFLHQLTCPISVVPSALAEVPWSGCRFHVTSFIFLPMESAIPHVLVFLPLGNNVTCTSPPVSASAGPSISPMFLLCATLHEHHCFDWILLCCGCVSADCPRCVKKAVWPLFQRWTAMFAIAYVDFVMDWHPQVLRLILDLTPVT